MKNLGRKNDVLLYILKEKKGKILRRMSTFLHNKFFTFDRFICLKKDEGLSCRNVVLQITTKMKTTTVRKITHKIFRSLCFSFFFIRSDIFHYLLPHTHTHTHTYTCTYVHAHTHTHTHTHTQIYIYIYIYIYI